MEIELHIVAQNRPAPQKLQKLPDCYLWYLLEVLVLEGDVVAVLAVEIANGETQQAVAKVDLQAGRLTIQDDRLPVLRELHQGSHTLGADEIGYHLQADGVLRA